MNRSSGPPACGGKEGSVNGFVILTGTLTVVAGLLVWYSRLRAGDRMNAIMARMSTTSMVASRAQLDDGVIADCAILRLRAHGRAFEFVLDTMAAERWCHILPPHRMDETGSVRVMMQT